jgi:hypothetical protein
MSSGTLALLGVAGVVLLILAEQGAKKRRKAARCMECERAAGRA